MLEMPDKITINLTYVWLVLKIAIGIGLHLWESKLLPDRAIHLLARRLCFHIVLNPEWALLKLIIFIPIWLWSGQKMLSSFWPVQGMSPSYRCAACQDKGYVWGETKRGGKTTLTKLPCSCQFKDYWEKVSETYL